MKKVQRIGLFIVAGTLVACIAAVVPSYATVPGTNTLVSVNSSGDGQGGNGNSPFNISGTNQPRISANGKYVLFPSNATNLVTGDTNAKGDLFLRNLGNNSTTRVNVSTSGVESNNVLGYGGSNNFWAISSTGRYVAFASSASNLIDGQTIPSMQVYMRDTTTNTTSLVTQLSNGTLGNGVIDSVNGVSNDGRFVAWKGQLNTNLIPGWTNSQADYVYLTDLKTKTTTVLNSPPASGALITGEPTMSCDGSMIAFATPEQLDPADTDAAQDVYIVDVRNGMTKTGATISSNTGKAAYYPSLSCNGEFMTFDTTDYAFSTLVSMSNSLDHQYLFDRIDNTINIVDTSSSGVLGTGSANGLASVDDKGNVVFFTAAKNLITGATFAFNQTYLKYKDTGTVELVSRTPGGGATAESNGGGWHLSVSADGKKVVYTAWGAPSTLFSSDTNGKYDVTMSLTGL